MNNNEKKAHIEGINKSLKCLRDAGLWEDFREIVLEGIVKLSEKYREDRRVNLAEFEKRLNTSNKLEEEEEWRKEIDDIIDLSNRKDDNEFA